MEKIIISIGTFLQKVVYSFAWLAVFLIKENGRNYVRYEKRGKPLRILANGPSLKKEMEQIEKDFDNFDYCLINFSYRNQLFEQVRPQMYVLADPAFFGPEYSPEMIRCFEQADWDMTLYIPYRFRRSFPGLSNPHVKVLMFHKGEYKGFECIKRFLYKKGLSMPRPQNVLVAAIFNAINAGYQKVELYGVDHSWTRDMVINDQNEVCSIDSHYYDTKQVVLRPAALKSNGEKPTFHESLRSLALAFESYHKLRKYADYRGVEILTMTQGSFIDAFERGYKH